MATFCVQVLLMICVLAGVNAAPTQDDKKCGGIFYDHFGEIQSPNYPKRWKEDSIDCVWTIQAPQGKNVRVTFLDFQLEDFFGECSLEKLSVHDGAHITGPALGKLLCGDSNPPMVTSNDNALTLYLTSQDGANYGSGFKLQWDFVEDNEPHSCSMNTCGGRVVNKPGCSVQSPSYPHKYDANLTCSWVLETSSEEPISVEFIDMMMYLPEDTGTCSVNYVTVYDGPTTSSKVILDKSCQKDDDEEMKVTSSGKTMLVVLTTGAQTDEGASDFEHHYRGFSLDVSMPGIPTQDVNTDAPITIPPTDAPHHISDHHDTDDDGDESPIVTSSPPNPATVSGVVIGAIVGVVVLALGVLVFVAFVHWRRQNHRVILTRRGVATKSYDILEK